MSGTAKTMQLLDNPQENKLTKRVFAMAGSNFIKRVTKFGSLLAVVLVFCAPLASHAQVDKVTTFKDDSGWKLQVNGEDYYMKGVVWGYTPRGQNYAYNLFGQSDDFIRKVLDYEFGLMEKWA